MKAVNQIQLSAVDRTNPVLVALADAYRMSRAGNVEHASRAFFIPYEKLVHDRARAGVMDEQRAYTLLLRLETQGIIRLNRVPLARAKIKTVFIERASEARFFEVLNQTPPQEERNTIIATLTSYQNALDGELFASSWKTALQSAVDDILSGRNPDGLPNAPALYHEILGASIAVVTNQSPVSLRRLSAVKLGGSKILQERRDAIERFMAQFLPPEMSTLDAWQVADEDPSVQLHGPLGVLRNDGTLVSELDQPSPYTVSDETLSHAVQLSTTAPRCVSIENLDTFRDVAALHTGDLLIHTSYPSRSVIKLLRALPPNLPLYHWGDTDPWGFDILRALREKTGRVIHPLHMRYRSCGDKKPLRDGTLTAREHAISQRLLVDTNMSDIHSELIFMQKAKNKGLFEQESLPKASGSFPYISLSSPSPPRSQFSHGHQ